MHAIVPIASSASMPGTVEHRPAEQLDGLDDRLDLQREVVGHRRARRLVLGVPVVAEGLALGVEDAGAVRRRVLLAQQLHHRRRRRGSRRSGSRRGRAGRAARGRRGRGSWSRRRAAGSGPPCSPLCGKWAPRRRRCRSPRIGAMKTSAAVVVAACCRASLRVGASAARRRCGAGPGARAAPTPADDATERAGRRAERQAHRHRRRPRPHRGAARARPAADASPSRRRAARPATRSCSATARATDRRRSRHVARRGRQARLERPAVSDARPDGGLHRGLVRRSRRARRAASASARCSRSRRCAGGIENTNYFADTRARPLRADAVRAADAPTSCRSTCS